MSMERVLVIFLLAAPLSISGWTGGWQEKVDPELLRAAGEVSFFLYLNDHADLAPARMLDTKEAKGRFVFETLVRVANRSQAGLVQELDAIGAEYRPFWIVNAILVSGDSDLLANLAQRAEVARVLANPVIDTRLPSPVLDETKARGSGLIEWNIALTGAPQVWDLGFNGQGVIIGAQDTGYDWQHPALRDQYLGWDGAAANHDYHWHDAIHQGGGSCGSDSPEPCDDFGHGTHTLGTALGADGTAEIVGMAPGARWIGCRNMDQGSGTPATYSECFQWFLAPTDIGGGNPDPTAAPHVIINSWGCPASEGCDDRLILQQVIANVRAAGIMVVTSAGNSGSGCGSVSVPPAIYGESFSVGATDMGDSIASFSSRGPVTVDGSNRQKPDVAAPGVGIRSTRPNNTYGLSNGTSMACPHVAGLVALLISARPELSGDVDELESIIRQTALKLTSNQDCNGILGDNIPNAVFGHGRIRALTAVQHALGSSQPGCDDGPYLLSLWPQAVEGFPDTDANGKVDVVDMIPFFDCLSGVNP